MVLKIKTNSRSYIDKEKAIREVTVDKTVRLNVNLPNMILKKFKLKTVENNTTMSKIILQWVNEYISK